MSQEVTQEQLDQLIEDASYLQDEAEALKYVIDEVPYQKSPPGNRSIAELLLLLDHAQLSYFRPILEEAVENPRPTHLENFEYFEESFVLDDEKTGNIQKVLNKIVKHRAGLVNVMKSTPLIDWETSIYKDDKEFSLYDFMQEMIRYERAKLKQIADLVMVFNQDKQAEREIKKRTGEKQESPEDR